MAKNNDDRPNPERKDNGDGTVTLTYRETEEQRKQRELEEKLAAEGRGPKK